MDPRRPERAKETPFGGTIAHGYYTLSLAPMFTEQILALEGFAFAINYGLNKVRFPAPLPVGSRVRMHAKLKALEEVPGGAQMTVEVTFEGEGGDKPVCVAETLARVYEELWLCRRLPRPLAARSASHPPRCRHRPALGHRVRVQQHRRAAP